MSSALPPAPFARYLLAKQSVDDRALNRGVYEALLTHLPTAGAPPLHVLEVGCGVGTMLNRLQRWGFLAGRHVDYLGIDTEASNLTAAHAPEIDTLSARFETADIYDFADRPSAQDAYDLIIAHAVLDLLELDRALPLLRRLLRPGGLGWFTINFDGMTVLEPPLDAALDAAIEAAYHATMDARTVDGAPSGASRTGRRLFAALPQAGLPILTAGASDWVVFPARGAYLGDERDFLESILDFFESALRVQPEIAPAALKTWLTERRAQVARAELTFIAHQIDFLVERPAEVHP